jgi:hypothetical protein
LHFRRTGVVIVRAKSADDFGLLFGVEGHWVSWVRLCASVGEYRPARRLVNVAKRPSRRAILQPPPCRGTLWRAKMGG